MIPRTGGGGGGGGGATSSKQKPAVRKPNQKGVQDQPLTFQKKIKSSGYTSAPRYSIIGQYEKKNTFISTSDFCCYSCM